MSTRRLDNYQAREALAMYLCKVPDKYIEGRFRIKIATIVQTYMRTQFDELRDPLVDVLKNDSRTKGLRNSSLIYLAFQHRTIPNAHLVDTKMRGKDYFVYKAIKEQIYDPMVKRIVDSFPLDELIASTDGAELRFLETMFGTRTAKALIRGVLIDK